MSPTNSSVKRREMDIRKLILSDYRVKRSEESDSALEVEFHGPADTHYYGGVWQVQVTIPPDYPYHSPSVGFRNRLFHPNVDERSGSVCLDVINQTWSPMYDLLNIFDTFLPQLLTYPNPTDPLNSYAASLMMHSPEAFKEKCREHVEKYALSTSSSSQCTKSNAYLRRETCGSESMVPESFSSSDTFALPEVSSPPASVGRGFGVDDGDLSSLSNFSDDENNLVLDL